MEKKNHNYFSAHKDHHRKVYSENQNVMGRSLKIKKNHNYVGYRLVFGEKDFMYT